MWWIHENRVYKLCDLWKALTHLFHYYDLTVGPYRKQNRQKHLSSHDTCYYCVPCLSFSVSQVVKVFLFVFFFPCICGFQIHFPEFHFYLSSWLIDIFIYASPGCFKIDMFTNIFSPADPFACWMTPLPSQTPQKALLRPPPFPLPHILPIQPPKFLSAASPFLHPAMP